LDDFVNHKKPEKNNRNRKIINQEQFRFIGKDYEFPYQKMRDELFANYKKKPPQPPQQAASNGKKKWTKKNNGKSQSDSLQVADQAAPQPSSQQYLQVLQAKPYNSSDKDKQGKQQEKPKEEKKFKKFPNKSK
jgi:hypothetical protein